MYTLYAVVGFRSCFAGQLSAARRIQTIQVLSGRRIVVAAAASAMHSHSAAEAVRRFMRSRRL